MTPGHRGAAMDHLDDSKSTVKVQTSLDIGLPVKRNQDGRVVCYVRGVGIHYQSERGSLHSREDQVGAYIERAGCIVLEKPGLDLGPIFLDRRVWWRCGYGWGGAGTVDTHTPL